MKIASASIEMQAAHAAYSRTEISERLEVWVGERNRPGANEARTPPSIRDAGRTLVDLSKEAIAASKSEAIEEEVDPLESDPRLKLLRNLIELLTGRPLRVLRSAELPRASAPAQPPPDQPPAEGTRNAQARPAGFGIEYDFSSRHEEHEHTRFEANGTVRTTDGREIRFDVAFEMERHYAESVDIRFRAGDARLKDPLVLDFAGPAAALSSVRFEFDLDADGELDQLPTLTGGRGFLALDRDGNGRIDDGRELFGPMSGDGFAELATLDSDGNGWIDEADAAYSQLHVWRPGPEGGVLQSLMEAGVGAIHLGRVATPFDLRGPANETLGVMRASGVYLREDGSAGTISQIDLSV